MGSLERNKHVSEDSISVDSISFAGLVSIQDQQPNHTAPSHNKQHYQYHVSKQDSDFEFTTVKTNLNSATNPFKITPADVLISNGQIKPHAIAFQPNQSFFSNPPISLRSLLAIEHISSKVVIGETNNARRYQEQLVKARNLKNNETTEARTWFGQKVLKSFISPCRKCEAVQPGVVKGQIVQPERYKIQ